MPKISSHILWFFLSCVTKVGTKYIIINKNNRLQCAKGVTQGVTQA